MAWNKLGRIFNVSQETELMYSHAMTPVPIHLYDDVYRIIFNSRDQDNTSRPFYVDFDLQIRAVLNIGMEPLLKLGDIGSFDECGIVISSVLQKNDNVFFYYLGFPRIAKELFCASIGLAKGRIEPLQMEKMFVGPIKGVLKDEGYFSTGPRVLFDKGKYKMWYASCVGWKVEGGKNKHYYHIKYSESDDGINWEEGRVAIDFKNEYEYALSIPSIIKDENKEIYRMWYTFRAQKNISSYRIGYAESVDGIDWIRKDGDAGIDVSDTGWDSQMICFPSVFFHKSQLYMLYNGNKYGETGFGLALWGD